MRRMSRLLPAVLLACLAPGAALAQSVSIDLGESGQLTGRIVQLIALITVLSLAPSILVVVTSFTRIVIVLSLVRSALGTQMTPPNVVLISLALLKSPRFKAWLGWAGLASSVVYLSAQTELLATSIPGFPVVPEAGLIGSLMWLAWIAALGITLVLPARNAPGQDQ